MIDAWCNVDVFSSIPFSPTILSGMKSNETGEPAYPEIQRIMSCQVILTMYTNINIFEYYFVVMFAYLCRYKLVQNVLDKTIL